jgi:hypothetical protein
MTIKELIKEYPNDMELGQKIREIYSNKPDVFKLEKADIYLVFDGLRLLKSEMYENNELARFNHAVELLEEMKKNCSWTEDDERKSFYSDFATPSKCIPGSNCD